MATASSASWDDDFHHALHTVLTGENSGYYLDFGRVAQLAKAFTDAYVYDGEFSEFRQRRHGRPAEDLSGRLLRLLPAKPRPGWQPRLSASAPPAW